MQPYFFPYIGYYQLAYEVEKFIFLDDVNFIKKGYINRNSISIKNQRYEFSIPVSKISQNRHINEHDYTGEFSSFLKLIDSAYKKAPFFKDAFPIIESIALDPDQNVARKNAFSINSVFNYLGIQKEFDFSSKTKLDGEPKGQNRILSLCQALKIDQYRNAIGGQVLYDSMIFNQHGIELKFIETHKKPYPQGTGDFLPYLSMIDILMHCDKEKILNLLAGYYLV